MRKRFQGLSLEDQRRMKQKSKKSFLQRRSSRSSAGSTLKRSAAEPGLKGSSSHIAAIARPPGNPFGLQVRNTSMSIVCGVRLKRYPC